MDNIIKDFIDINNDIVTQYKESKSIGFIKKIRFRKNTNELMKKVDRLFQDNTVAVKIISNYAMVLSEEFKPYGTYLHCRRTLSNKKSSISTFEFKINDSSLVVSIYPSNEDGSECAVNYSYIHNSKALLSFTDYNVKLLKFDSVYSEDDIDIFDMGELACILRFLAANYIMNDIKEYLKSKIYNGDL